MGLIIVKIYDLNRSQLATLIEKHTEELTSNNIPERFTVGSFLQREEENKADYLINPVVFLNEKLKNEIIPKYIITDSIVGVFDDVLYKCDQTIKTGLDDDELEEVTGRVDNILKTYEDSILNEVKLEINKGKDEAIKEFTERMASRFNPKVKK